MGKLLFKIFLSLLVAAGFLGAKGLTALAFEAHRLGVAAVIEAPEALVPTCPEVEINEILTVSRASFPGKTVVIRQGSGFVSRSSNLRLDVGCDLIVEQGGFIRAGDTTNSSLRLNVGQNLRLEGEVSADSSQDGGIVRIDVGQDAQILGSLSASGQEDGGMVRLGVGGNLEINSSSLKVNGQDGQGGLLRLQAGKTLDLKGRLEAEGEKEGGMIRISASRAQISGRLSASGTIDGGRIRFSVDQDLTIQGQSLDLSGLEGGGGSLILEAGGNINIGGKILGNGRISGGSLSLSTSQDLEVAGQIEAWASEGQGGTISLEASQGLMKISGTILAGGQPPGRINLSFCQKDFSGASFDPQPSEQPACTQTDSGASANPEIETSFNSQGDQELSGSLPEPGDTFSEEEPLAENNPGASEESSQSFLESWLLPDSDSPSPYSDDNPEAFSQDISSEGSDTSLLPPVAEISLPPPEITPPEIPEIEEPIIEMPEIQGPTPAASPTIEINFPP